MRRKVVSYVFPTSHKFRNPFHSLLRELLAAEGVEYRYICADAESEKGDTEKLHWAEAVPVFEVRMRSSKLIFQNALFKTWNDDLVILQQENRLLANYLIIMLRRLFRKRVAFFGHGRNFQSNNPSGISERFKAFWSLRVDWWFAYTERSGRIVRDLGFPSNRITVFNNAIDTNAIAREIADVDYRELEGVRSEKLASSRNVGIYLGSLYDIKRVSFLLEAAVFVRDQVPDFHLVVVGGGPDAHVVEAAAKKTPWIHFDGPKFGREKTFLAKLAKVQLMPGAMGLGILDSFAYGTPIVTSALYNHGPEIDYLLDGVNGIIVQESDSVQAYANAVVSLLKDEELRQQMASNSKEAAARITIEAMAGSFKAGVLEALNARVR